MYCIHKRPLIYFHMIKSEIRILKSTYVWCLQCKLCGLFVTFKLFFIIQCIYIYFENICLSVVFLGFGAPQIYFGLALFLVSYDITWLPHYLYSDVCMTDTLHCLHEITIKFLEDCVFSSQWV